MVCLTQRFDVPADSLGRQWLPAQASPPFGGVPQKHDQARLAWTTGHEPGQRYALLQLFSPPRFPTCKPRKTHPCRAIHTRAAWQKVPISTCYHIQKGPKEEALPTKITPLASNYTARVAHRPSSAPQKKGNIITLLTHGSHFLCQKPSEKQPPICRRHVGKLFTPTQDILPDLPGLPTYLQFPLASHCSGCRCCQLLRSVPQRLPSEAGQ